MECRRPVKDRRPCSYGVLWALKSLLAQTCSGFTKLKQGTKYSTVLLCRCSTYVPRNLIKCKDLAMLRHMYVLRTGRPRFQECERRYAGQPGRGTDLVYELADSARSRVVQLSKVFSIQNVSTLRSCTRSNGLTSSRSSWAVGLHYNQSSNRCFTQATDRTYHTSKS